MPSHVHTPPQCGFWTGHDPSCFDQEFGVEIDCVLIEVGKNKGNYLCIHERAPISRRVDALNLEYSAEHGGCFVEAPGAAPGEDGFAFVLSPEVAGEYLEIRRQLHGDDDSPAADAQSPAAEPPAPTTEVPDAIDE